MEWVIDKRKLKCCISELVHNSYNEDSGTYSPSEYEIGYRMALRDLLECIEPWYFTLEQSKID